MHPLHTRLPFRIRTCIHSYLPRIPINSFHTSTNSRTIATNTHRTKPLECYVSKTNDPYWNLAFEDWLFRTSDPNAYVLYLWRNDACVVIGRNQNPWKECNIPYLRQHRIPLIRRKSGGGTVFHDLGNSLYSIMMPREKFDRKTNAMLVCRALTHHLDIPANVNERHDIVVGGKKISGSAYKLVSQRAYHHGTMLIDTDLDTLRNALKVTKPGMVTKGVASVPSPVTRLREHSYTVSHMDFCEAVMTEFAVEHNWLDIKPVYVDLPLMKSNTGIREVYEELTSYKWTFGQTPQFTHTLTNQFSWGKVDIKFESRHNIIESVSVSTDRAELMELMTEVESVLMGRKYDPEDVVNGFATLLSLEEEDTHDNNRELVDLKIPPSKIVYEDIMHWLEESM